MKRYIFACATVFAMLAAACGGSDNTENVSSDDGGGGPAETIKVAVVAPFTGRIAYLGGSLRAPVEMYFDEVNAEGLEVDGKTYRFEVVEGDDQATPDVAVTTVKRLLTEDGIKYFLGPMASGATSAVEPLMKANPDTLWIISSAAVEGPTKNPNVFRNASLMKVYNNGTLEWLKENNIKTVALMTDQTHTAIVQSTETFTKKITEAGTQVVANETFSVGATDFRATITSLKAKAPEAIVFRGYPAEAATFRKQAQELGATWKEVWTTKIADTDMKKLGSDEQLNGVVACYDPGVAEFAKTGDEQAAKNLERLGADYSNLSDKAYDSAVILVAGMKKAGSVDPKKVGAALESLKVEDIKEDVMGKYKPQAGALFRDHEVDIDPICAEWTSGSWKVLP